VCRVEFHDLGVGSDLAPWSLDLLQMRESVRFRHAQQDPAGIFFWAIVVLVFEQGLHESRVIRRASAEVYESFNVVAGPFAANPC
jgi:hypothetical protein